MVYEAIRELVRYGLEKGLITEDDAIYARNQILEVLKMDEYEEPEKDGELTGAALEKILKVLLDYAAEKGLLQENSVVYRDLFDTKLMNCLMPRPSEVTKTFWEKYQVSPETATDYYYNLSRNSDYIRRYRVSKDMKWTTDTKYGTLDITVNLSKPEKDPKAIAAAKLAKQSGYPKCQLCMVRNQEMAELSLKDIPYIGRHTDSPFYDRIEQWKQENGCANCRTQLWIDDISSCLEMVENGIGWSILPEICLKNYKGSITPLFFQDGSPFIRTSHILYKSHYFELPQVRAFIQTVLAEDTLMLKYSTIFPVPLSPENQQQGLHRKADLQLHLLPYYVWIRLLHRHALQ